MSEPLEASIRSAGYTPRVRDVPRLFELLSGDDEKVAAHAERALARAARAAEEEARRRFDASVPPLRSRIVALVGRLVSEQRDAELERWLVLRLGDADPKARRRAASALGKLGDEGFEAPLVERWKAGADPAERRAIAAALGKVGGEVSAELLEGVLSVEADPSAEFVVDAELRRLAGEARLQIERRALRTRHARIAADRAPEEPIPVLLHVRAGLEELLVEELAAAGHPGARARGRGRVGIMLAGPLSRVFRARTFLHLGFPLPAVPLEEDMAEAVASVLASKEALAIFRTFTEGPLRYRVEWADAGRRRAVSLRVAERVRSLCPDLVNDATQAPWEAVVSERHGPSGATLHVELWPRALEDPRFTYRKRTLPAASHGTIAAALARVGGARPDDVVWDPFVGSASELVERARLGPYRSLLGTDTSEDALAAARENLAAAGVGGVRLSLADARSFRPPEPVSLVLTNPPFGRRVLEPSVISPLLEQTLENARAVIAPGGRMVWASPVPDVTAAVAARLGFTVRLRQAVDLGGISAEIQSFSVDGGRDLRARVRRGR